MFSWCTRCCVYLPTVALVYRPNKVSKWFVVNLNRVRDSKSLDSIKGLRFEVGFQDLHVFS